MLDIRMARGARKIVEQCAGVRPGEKVLVVTDTGSDFAIARALAAAAQAAGANASIIVSEPVAKSGDDPHPSVCQAMLGADVIFIPTSKSIFHTGAVRRALETGRSRLFSLSEAKPDTLIAGAIEVNFLERKPYVDALAKKMAEGRRIKVMAPAGTELEASIEGRMPVGNTGICDKPGMRMGAALEVFIAPVEDTTTGTFVCDVMSSSIGLVSEPIRIRFDHGRAVEISGGKEAQKLRGIVEAVGSPDAYTAAEIAFGLNPVARITGDIIEDEGKYGTGHVALGNNLGFGGKSGPALHIDMVYWKPSVWIDGEHIFQDGVLLIK